jgi:hypothetical protein
VLRCRPAKELAKSGRGIGRALLGGSHPLIVNYSFGPSLEPRQMSPVNIENGDNVAETSYDYQPSYFERCGNPGNTRADRPPKIPAFKRDAGRGGSWLTTRNSATINVLRVDGAAAVRCRYHWASALSFWNRRNRHTSWTCRAARAHCPSGPILLSRRLAPLSSGEPVSPA